MKVIRAEESLHAATVAALGSGMMKPEDARAIRRQWEMDAGRKRAVIRPKSHEEFAAALAALGVGWN